MQNLGFKLTHRDNPGRNAVLVVFLLHSSALTRALLLVKAVDSEAIPYVLTLRHGFVKSKRSVFKKPGRKRG